MKVVKSGKNNWVAISADGRCLSNGYPQSSPAEARRAGELAIKLESLRTINGDSAAIKWILENL